MNIYLAGLLALSIVSALLAIRAKHHFTTLVCGWCTALAFIAWRMP